VNNASLAGINNNISSNLSDSLIEKGLMSHQTHYRSYGGQVFTSQMTQPTNSKHWSTTGFKGL